MKKMPVHERMILGPLVVMHTLERPIPRGDVTTYSDFSNYDDLRSIAASIRATENYYRAVLGLPYAEEVIAMELPREDRRRVQERMKLDGIWLDLYHSALAKSGAEPVAGEEEQMGAINLPDWNDLTANILNMRFDGDSLYIDLGIAHTYATQLNRMHLLREGSFRPLSVYGNVLSSAGSTEMGIRTGKVKGSAHMVMPAGSLYATRSLGKATADPFEGFLRELAEETGLRPEEEGRDYEIQGIAGSFVERTSGTHGLVFSVQTSKTEDELREIWKTRGNAEHSDIFFVGRDEMPEYVLGNAERRRDVTLSTDKNYPLVASGAAALLVQAAHTSPDAFRRVMTDLDGFYARE